MKRAWVLFAMLVAGCIFPEVKLESNEPRELERGGFVTRKGKMLALVGPSLSVGDRAPNFKVVDRDFKPVRLTDSAGKVRLISVVPSLDTGVCARQAKQFDEAMAKLSKRAILITLSADLPFAQQRFCSAAKLGRSTVLSDFVWRDFGRKYGVLVQPMGVLARSVFVIDKKGRIRYMEIVTELTDEPDYRAALEAVQKVSGG
jgi:thiol peroxidase